MIIKIAFIILGIIFVYGAIILLCSFDHNTNYADYLIVLGHKLKNDCADDVLLYRLKETLKYAQNNKKTTIVLSGGITKGNTVSEAYIMKQYLVLNNVDETRIILEDKSTDTVENIENCLEYINKENKVVLISSNYHILRSKMICKLLGIDVLGIGVYTPIFELTKHLLIEELFIFIHYNRIKKKLNK